MRWSGKKSCASDATPTSDTSSTTARNRPASATASIRRRCASSRGPKRLDPPPTKPREGRAKSTAPEAPAAPRGSAAQTARELPRARRAQGSADPPAGSRCRAATRPSRYCASSPPTAPMACSRAMSTVTVTPTSSVAHVRAFWIRPKGISNS